jgi:hypothetical protein
MYKPLQMWVCVLAGFGAQMALPPSWGGPSVALAAGTQSVTVYAGSEGEALRLAEKQNSGWTAISATKIAPKDPKSRPWGVKMRK